MAPELHLPESYDTKRADIFSTGVILFAMLTQSLPFEYSIKATSPNFAKFIDHNETFWSDWI